MEQSQSMEDKVLSAVKDFASSIRSGNQVAVADMSALVAVTSQIPLVNLDYWERLIRTEFASSVTTVIPASWKFWSKSYQRLTWLDLMSWDGYRREKTLRTISGAAPNAFFFSCVIRRLNDWVPQVRQAAREMLPLMVKRTALTQVVEALCLTLSHWSSWGRIEKEGQQVLLQIINDKAVAEALKLKLIQSTSRAMPSLFAQIGRTESLDDALGEIAKNAIQPAVRAKAYRSLFEKRMVWIDGRTWEWAYLCPCEGRLKAAVSERKLKIHTSFKDLLDRSSNDRSSIVRCISAEFLLREIEQLGSDSKMFAERFASDKSGLVSEKGQFALKQLEMLRG
ncbi:hypothetical protein P4S72_03750 [Vibrio sp. PP-XX7]